MEKLFLTDKELSQFGNIDNLSQEAESLLNHQKANWELLKNNFESLSNTKSKSFEFNNSLIKVQFNPTRITSTSAKVDKKSIEKRKCFLCLENLPNEQKGIKFKKDFIILCNPYPIFNQHLTVAYKNHIPQSIESNFQNMLELSYDLREKFFVFYNGPKCGASAPDHLHFQAGLKDEIPIYSNYINSTIKNDNLIYNKKEVKISFIKSEIQKFVLFESKNKIELENIILKTLEAAKKILSTNEEPLINILSFYVNDFFNVVVFLREKHRPEQYYEGGERQLLISPASVDLGGLVIAPREEDFNKITIQDIVNIFGQVLLDSNKTERILRSCLDN